MDYDWVTSLVAIALEVQCTVVTRMPAGGDLQLQFLCRTPLRRISRWWRAGLPTAGARASAQAARRGSSTRWSRSAPRSASAGTSGSGGANAALHLCVAPRARRRRRRRQSSSSRAARSMPSKPIILKLTISKRVPNLIHTIRCKRLIYRYRLLIYWQCPLRITEARPRLSYYRSDYTTDPAGVQYSLSFDSTDPIDHVKFKVGSAHVQQA